MEVFPGTSMDPDVRFGKPCLSGTRIDVASQLIRETGPSSLEPEFDPKP